MLIEQIKKDRIVAFKAKENIKKDILGCLISESSKESKEPSDEKVLGTIKKFIDGANEVIKYSDRNSYETYKANQEIKILTEYRPKQMTEEEIKSYINQINSDLKSFGEVATLGYIMKHFKENYSDQYNGAIVSKIAKELLK